MCVDVSGLAGHDEMLTAAVLLATWNEAYGTVWAANALADAGVAPQRHTLVVLDELWRVLSAGPGMVDRINFLGRTNRQDGVGQIAITHTMADLNALASESRPGQGPRVHRTVRPADARRAADARTAMRSTPRSCA